MRNNSLEKVTLFLSGLNNSTVITCSGTPTKWYLLMLVISDDNKDHFVSHLFPGVNEKSMLIGQALGDLGPRLGQDDLDQLRLLQFVPKLVHNARLQLLERLPAHDPRYFGFL